MAHSLYTDYEAMDLRVDLLRGIYAYGFERPSRFQQRAVVPLIRGRHVIAQNTLNCDDSALCIACIQRVDLSIAECQVLILQPTRSLVAGTLKLLKSLSAYLSGLSCCALRDMPSAQAQAPPHIAVCTPHTLDFFDLSDFDALSLVTLNKSDEMISRGFTENIKQGFSRFRDKVQLGILSATMSAAVVQMADRLMDVRDHIRILQKREELTLDGVHQYYIDVEKEQWKWETLCDLFEELQRAINPVKCIVFVNSSERMRSLAFKMRMCDLLQSLVPSNATEMDLLSAGFVREQTNAIAFRTQIPAAMVGVVAAFAKMYFGPCVDDWTSKRDRERMQRDFRSGATRIIIATDLSQRLSVQNNSGALMINYDLPHDTGMCSYLTRIGQSGAYGRKATVMSFVTDQEKSKIRGIERFFNTQIDELPMDVLECL